MSEQGRRGGSRRSGPPDGRVSPLRELNGAWTGSGLTVRMRTGDSALETERTLETLTFTFVQIPPTAGAAPAGQRELPAVHYLRRTRPVRVRGKLAAELGLWVSSAAGRRIPPSTPMGGLLSLHDGRGVHLSGTSLARPGAIDAAALASVVRDLAGDGAAGDYRTAAKRTRPRTGVARGVLDDPHLLVREHLGLDTQTRTIVSISMHAPHDHDPAPFAAPAPSDVRLRLQLWLVETAGREAARLGFSQVRVDGRHAQLVEVNVASLVRR